MCRVVGLAFQPKRLRGPGNLTALTAACGWTDTVVQGVEWGRDPARERWLTHQCPDTNADPTGPTVIPPGTSMVLT